MRILRKNANGITLIALVITIILLLILAGITITQLTGSGLFGNAKKAKEISDYISAKEIVQMKLMEIQVECIKEERDYTIVEIAKSMALDEGITIEKYYNSNTAMRKPGVTENLVYLKGIVVSVNQYSKYKFLIGEGCEIEGVTIEKITDTFGKEDFKPVEEFEREILGITPGTGGSGDGEDKDNPQEGTVDVPSVGDDVDLSNPIEITTYMAIKSNSKNTLNLTGVENASYEIQEKTENVALTENIVTANKNADSKDSCLIKITGTYNKQSYTNFLIIYVEPKNIQTIDGEEYYRIYTAKDLIRFKDLINKNIGSTQNALLENNIDLSNINWEPIGNWVDNGNKPYKGIFNGKNNTINNIYINNDKDIQGLFGKLEGATVKNVVVQGEIHSSGDEIGGICGEANDSNISRCINKIEIVGNDKVGGICGNNVGNIIECANKCENIQGKCNVGGIVGNIVKSTTKESILESCYNKANITGEARIGGIAGYAELPIYGCYNRGDITSSGVDINNMSCAGGIIGIHYETNGVQCCYNTGTITATYYYAGGIQGYSNFSNSQYLINLGIVQNDNDDNKIIATEDYYVYPYTGGWARIGAYWADAGSLSNYIHIEDETKFQGTNANEYIIEYLTKDELGKQYFIIDENVINDGYPILSWQNN